MSQNWPIQSDEVIIRRFLAQKQADFQRIFGTEDELIFDAIPA